jgi:hypothetical protein
VLFRAYSGYPINETVGFAVNGDRDEHDRPVRGVDDAIRPRNPTGNRNSSRFLESAEAGPMRSMQLGVRYTF